MIDEVENMLNNAVDTEYIQKDLERLFEQNKISQYEISVNTMCGKWNPEVKIYSVSVSWFYLDKLYLRVRQINY